MFTLAAIAAKRWKSENRRSLPCNIETCDQVTTAFDRCQYKKFETEQRKHFLDKDNTLQTSFQPAI